VQDREYVKMDAVEERMFYYRALHERLRLCLDRFASADASVLDAGCGTGGLLQDLQRRRPRLRLAGLDASPIACEIARRKTGLPIEQASVDAPPFEDERFDAIVSGDVLYMLDDPRSAIRELERCLKHGGVLVLNVPAYEWLRSYHDVAVGTKHRFTRAELVAMLGQADLDVVFATYWNALLFPLVVIRRKLLARRSGESDVTLNPPFVEAALGAVLRLEARLTERGIGLPFGSSVLVAARRP
jgi:SAM-dependent methyltransferase